MGDQTEQFDGTQWVAVGRDGTVLTSPDGITWTSQEDDRE